MQGHIESWRSWGCQGQASREAEETKHRMKKEQNINTKSILDQVGFGGIETSRLVDDMSVTIMTDLLKNPELSEEKREEFTDKIDSQVNRITWLIRNLLTLSQLDADMLRLKKDEVSVQELLRRACQPFEILAELKGVELRILAGEDMRMVCDERWTEESISNIVKNCIEHTFSGGKVEITADQSNFSTNIRIKDNGEGIAREHLPHIFERFYKVGSHSEDSMGIGLAMSKQIIMKQNGTVSVKSEAGKGTEFHIKMYSEVVI